MSFFVEVSKKVLGKKVMFFRKNDVLNFDIRKKVGALTNEQVMDLPDHWSLYLSKWWWVGLFASVIAELHLAR